MRVEVEEVLTVEVRFFADSEDEAAELTIECDGFAIKRPDVCVGGEIFGRHDLAIAADKILSACPRSPSIRRVPDDVGLYHLSVVFRDACPRVRSAQRWLCRVW